MRRHAGERVPLEARARVQETRRHPPGRRCRADPRREPGLRLLRQVEPVGSEADRLLPLWRVLEPGEHLADADEPVLAVGGPFDLDSCAVEQVALGRAEPLLETLRQIPPIETRRARDDVALEAARR